MTKGLCIWVTGQSAAGKTTLAAALERALLRPVTRLDGDEVRETLSSGLGFSREDRARNVERIALVAREAVRHGGTALVSCISPHREARERARESIGEYFEVKVETPLAVRQQRDAKGIYQNSDADDYEDGTADMTVSGDAPVEETVLAILCALRDRGHLGTALMIGRWQPWHDGHTALFERALAMEGFVAIGVRDRRRIASDPFGFAEVSRRIDEALAKWRGRYEILPLPDVTNVIYGRRVGYRVTAVELDAATETISATALRKEINA